MPISTRRMFSHKQGHEAPGAAISRVSRVSLTLRRACGGLLRRIHAPPQTPGDLSGDHLRQPPELLALGFEPQRNSPEAYLALIKSDIVKWGKVVRDSGAKVD